MASSDQILAAMLSQGETLKVMMETMLRNGGNGGGGQGEGASACVKKLEGNLIGKEFLSIPKFEGGEEWNNWAEDVKILVDIRSEMTGQALSFIRKEGKPEREVMTEDQVHEGLAAGLEGDWMAKADMKRVSKELYRILHHACKDEAKTIVRDVEDNDGFQAWGKLSAKYGQRTLTRMMRIQQE